MLYFIANYLEIKSKGDAKPEINDAVFIVNGQPQIGCLTKTHRGNH
jgi:hypothetical protein